MKFFLGSNGKGVNVWNSFPQELSIKGSQWKSSPTTNQTLTSNKSQQHKNGFQKIVISLGLIKFKFTRFFFSTAHLNLDYRVEIFLMTNDITVTLHTSICFTEVVKSVSQWNLSGNEHLIIMLWIVM